MKYQYKGVYEPDYHSTHKVINVIVVMSITLVVDWEKWSCLLCPVSLITNFQQTTAEISMMCSSSNNLLSVFEFLNFIFTFSFDLIDGMEYLQLDV